MRGRTDKPGRWSRGLHRALKRRSRTVSSAAGPPGLPADAPRCTRSHQPSAAPACCCLRRASNRVRRLEVVRPRLPGRSLVVPRHEAQPRVDRRLERPQRSPAAAGRRKGDAGGGGLQKPPPLGGDLLAGKVGARLRGRQVSATRRAAPRTSGSCLRPGRAGPRRKEARTDATCGCECVRQVGLSEPQLKSSGGE